MAIVFRVNFLVVRYSNKVTFNGVKTPAQTKIWVKSNTKTRLITVRSKPISDQKSGHCFQGPLFSCEATLDKTQNVPHSFLPNYTITRLISIVSKPIVFVFVFVWFG